MHTRLRPIQYSFNIIHLIESDRREYSCCAFVFQFVSKWPENHLDTYLKVEFMFKEPSHRFSISVKLPAFIGHFLSVRLSICLPVVSHKGRSSLHRLMPAFNPQAALLNPCEYGPRTYALCC